MKILILHRIPYYKIEYHRGIDHQKHQVTYIGTKEILSTIPKDIQCEKIERPGINPVEAEVASFIKKVDRTFDKVISLSEYELAAAASIRARFNIDGPLPSQIEKVRNKVQMKQCVKMAGIRTPAFLTVPDLIKSASKFLYRWNGKVVIKPVDGASSENVAVFNSLFELREKLLAQQTGIPLLDKKDVAHEKFEIEEFIYGPIWHIDGLMHQGKLVTCLASRYVGTCLEYAQGKPLGSIQVGASDFIQQWTWRCLRAVDITEGSFHLEAIEGSHGMVFLEVGNRVGGADVVKTFELATGIHLPSAELALMVGEDVKLPQYEIHDKFGWFVFPGHIYLSGYCQIKNTDEISKHPLILQWFQLPDHQQCKSTITYQPNEVPVAGVIKGAHFYEMYHFLKNLFKMVKVHELPVKQAKFA